MLKSWRSLLRCELATCVCFKRAYTSVCVCVYVCVCVCVRVHACLQPAHICQSNMDRILSEHAPIVIATLNIFF